MAQLRIERKSTILASSNCETGIDDYDRLLPDETISSWSNRHSFVRLIAQDPDERDFGTLEIDLPGARQELLNGLRCAATAPDAWLLRPQQRTLYCLKCLAEDRVLGLPFFVRRSWSVAWRTCCPRHGMLFDANQREMPSWHTGIFAPNWSGDKIEIFVSRRSPAALELNLWGSRRAIHLESALAENKQEGTWFPQGLNASSIRDVYRTIVTDLMSQFYIEFGAPAGFPSEQFKRQLNPNRFAINVLAEAILSEWTSTPLPSSASAQSSKLLVRAIGWGLGVPAILRRGQVLFRGPSERRRRLAHYERILGSILYQNVSSPCLDRHCGHFTLPEARRLGLNLERSLQWLAELTRRGQFQRFDAKAGLLTEDMMLPEEFRLQPEEARPYNLILPAWAFAPPESPKDWGEGYCMRIKDWTPALENYLKSKERIERKKFLRRIHLQQAIIRSAVHA